MTYQENENLRLAILIDAENISPKYVALIMREASVIGTLKYKKVYGNFAEGALHSWERAITENAMIPVQQFNNTRGKNSSDSALIIDAMDLLYKGNVDAFCLVTSDSDFTRLATRLGEEEKYVVGMGERKTAKSFINACDRFVYLDLLLNQERKEKRAAQPERSPRRGRRRSGEAETVVSELAGQEAAELEAVELESAEVSEEGTNLETIKAAIAALIDEKSDDAGWLFSGVLGNLLNKRYPDFDVRNFGFKKFIPFITSLGCFEIQKRPSGEQNGVDLVYIRNIEESNA